jgi:PiT family inorganic phosphate transporter
VGTGIVDPAIADHCVIFGALTGAIAWNAVRWLYGISSRSSAPASSAGLRHRMVARATGSATAQKIAKTGRAAAYRLTLLRPLLLAR